MFDGFLVGMNVGRLEGFSVSWVGAADGLYEGILLGDCVK